MNYDRNYFDELRGKLLLITSEEEDQKSGEIKENKQLGTISEIMKNGLEFSTKWGSHRLLYKDIIDVSFKKIVFTPPSKFFSVDIINKFATEIVEHIKNQKIYKLRTRSATFIKNGSLKKERLTQEKFATIVYEWLGKRRSETKLCPLALLNDTLLLCIYEGYFCLIRKNYAIVFQGKEDHEMLVNFITSRNDEIIRTKEKEYKTTFKGIISLLEDDGL
ncbi:MAG: hypothetical protein WC875_00240 [Candidatus Absconditabacterales bacterium]